MFCHHVPQLAITFCRKQLLTQQGTNALEDTPSKSEIFFLIRRDQKIFWYRSFQQLPLISVSCKYHPPSMSSYFSAWLRRMFLLAVFSLSPDLFLSQRCVAVYPVEDYMEMSGDCWVNTLPHRGLNGAQQINHLQLDISVLFKWLHSTATLWDRDIDLAC